ncbi:magnesium transporter [Bdellovibrionota bacterium]
MANNRRKRQRVEKLRQALEAGNREAAKHAMERVAGAEMVPLLTSLEEEPEALLLELIFSTPRAADILAELPDQFLEDLLEELSLPRILALLESVSVDDAFEIFQEIPEKRLEEIEANLSSVRLNQFHRLQKYKKGTVGFRMDPKTFSIKPTATADDAIARVREQVEEEQIFYVYVVDEAQKLLGVVSMRQLVSSPAQKQVKDIMTPTPITVKDTDDDELAAKLVTDHHYLGVPVVNDVGHLVGMVRIDDVIDIINEEATKDMYQLFGLSVDDRVFSPPMSSITKRLPWMMINLATAFLACWVVGLFEDSIEKVVSLAVFMPIVAGMGGNGGTQTLTVITRGLALGELAFTNAAKAVMKELTVSFAIGAGTGIITGLFVWLWKGNPWLGLVLFLAMIINLLIAGLAGTTIPLLLRLFKQDPAMGGGVIMTTFTDVFGFLSFLGIATMMLKYLV